jgi:putative transposase
VDRAFQACFQRIQEGQIPGDPRFHGFHGFHGRERYNSFTYPQFENGVRLDNGFLVLSKSGRSAVRWSRPIEGTSKMDTICREADGWYVCCADVPVQPVLATGQETGIDLGSKPSLRSQTGRASSTLAGIAKRSAHSRPPSAVAHAGSVAATQGASWSHSWRKRTRW